MRRARGWLRENTAAPRPKAQSLARATACSSLENVEMHITGPNTSSRQMSMAGVTPVITVGGKKSPLGWAGECQRWPPVSTCADRLGLSCRYEGGITGLWALLALQMLRAY